MFVNDTLATTTYKLAFQDIVVVVVVVLLSSHYLGGLLVYLFGCVFFSILCKYR